MPVKPKSALKGLEAAEEAASGITDGAARAAKKADLKSVKDDLVAAGDDVSKVDPKSLKNGNKMNTGKVNAFGDVLKNMEVPEGQVKGTMKNLSDVADGATSKELVEATGETVGKVGKTMEDAKSFFKKIFIWFHQSK
jgi:hypothetical protein